MSEGEPLPTLRPNARRRQSNAASFVRQVRLPRTTHDKYCSPIVGPIPRVRGGPFPGVAPVRRSLARLVEPLLIGWRSRKQRRSEPGYSQPLSEPMIGCMAQSNNVVLQTGRKWPCSA
jgi:hypothetical protein